MSEIEQQHRVSEFGDYLRRKVEAGRASVRAARGRPNDQVEARFAAKRDEGFAERV